MLIKCPKCEILYEVNDNLIPAKGRKVRCVSCREIWKVMREDAIAPQTIKNNAVITKLDLEPRKQESVKDIVSAINIKNHEVFRAPYQPIKAEKKSSSFWRLALYIIILALLGAFLFYARYGIVRKLPIANVVYNSIGVEASVSGYGLEFRDVTYNEFEEDFVKKLEINGTIINTTNYDINVPKIHVEMLDEKRKPLQSLNSIAPVETAIKNDSFSFNIVIIKPSSLMKYIVLGFK